jgi:3-isopropylmalate dehydratase small subunit
MHALEKILARKAGKKRVRAFCREQGTERLMDVNRGVCRQIAVDKGFSRPGALVVMTDSHATAHGALVAASFGRIFHRNAFNLGLPALICPGIAALVRRGDEPAIDSGRSLLGNLTRGREHAFEPVSPYGMEMLRAGGIKPLLKQRYGNARAHV